MKKNLIVFLFIFVQLLLINNIYSQEKQALPTGFRNINLGQTVDQVKDLLSKDSVFGFRGDRDVSLLPTQERVLIETMGNGFLDRCWFQFYEEKLYTMTINLNTENIDYYSVFTTLCDKYGQPTSLDPKKAQWVSDTVQVNIEKPLCLKYLDLKAYEKFEKSSTNQQSTDSYLRKNFLDSL